MTASDRVRGGSRILVDLVPAAGAHGQRGIGRYVRGLAEAIAILPPDLGRRVLAFGPRSEALDVFGDLGLEIDAGRGQALLPGWALGAVATARATRRAHAAALHATDPHRPFALGAGPAIVTVYDLIPLHEPSLLRQLRPDHRWVYSRYIARVRAASHIIAISRTTAADIVDHLGVPPALVHVVYPVVSLRGASVRLPSDEPLFLVIGALDQHKRPELALEAFARFRRRHQDGRLRYIGPTDERQAAMIRARADRLGVGAAISIEGRIPDSALDDAYATATALLFTSRIEGFGLPPVEAILRQTPVIAVDTPAAAETVGGIAALVPPEPDAIADAMESPPAVAESVATATARRFSPAAAAEALAAVYRLVLD